MNVRFDQKSDALYFRLVESPIVETEEVKLGVILDFNAKNQVVGVEILRVQERVPEASLKEMKFEVAQFRLTRNHSIQARSGQLQLLPTGLSTEHSALSTDLAVGPGTQLATKRKARSAMRFGPWSRAGQKTTHPGIRDQEKTLTL